MIHDIDSDELEWEPDEEIFDDYEEEERASTAPPPSLRQMERDGEAARKAVQAMLEADPDTPSPVLLAEMRKHVRPMSEYRPTEEEMLALRTADILHTLRGEKKNENNSDYEDDPAESARTGREGTSSSE